MQRQRSRVPPGHTAPSGAGERDVLNQVGISPREGEPAPLPSPWRAISARWGTGLAYLSLLPVEGPENGKKKI